MGLGSTNFPKKRDEWRNGRDEWLFLGMILIPDLETGSPKIAIHGILSLNSLTWEKSRFYLVLQEQKIHRRLDRIIFQTGHWGFLRFPHAHRASVQHLGHGAGRLQVHRLLALGPALGSAHRAHRHTADIDSVAAVRVWEVDFFCRMY